MPFNTRAEIKTFLGIPSAITTHDDLLDDLLDEVHGAILADVGGGLSAAWATTSYSQAFDIREAGRGAIRLPKWPVSSVEYVYTGTNGGASGSLVSSSAYYCTPEGVLRLQDSLPASGTVSRAAYWPVGMQNVTVYWKAGFAEDGRDWRSLKLAEKLTIAELYNVGPTTGKGGEKIGSYSYTRASASDRGGDFYPTAAARIIARYRSIIPSADPVIP